MDEYVQVNIGDCRCEGTPHEEGDVVYLRPRLDLRRGVAIQKLIVEANTAGDKMTEAEITGLLAEAYLLHGVAGWNLIGDAGKPLEVTPETIREQLIEDFSRGATAADRADELYLTPVILPLAKKAAASQQTTQTNGSTSAHRTTGSKRRKSSKPSSTSTTQTGVTATTSG